MNLLGLAAQHGGLIRHPHGLQVQVRIKSGGVCALEFFQEFLFVPAFQNEIADVIGFRQRKDDKVVSAAVSAGLRGGGLCFLMLGLAVNDAGDTFLGILADAFPNAHHVAAGGVHQFAAFGFEFFASADLGAEGGNDHGIAGLQLGQFLVGRFGRNDLDAQIADLIVHFRVVNDFAEEIDRRVGRDLGKIFLGGVGEVNRTLDAVTKAEFLREFDGELARGQDAATGANAFHQFAAVMGEDLRLHRFHDVRTAKVDFLRVGGGSSYHENRLNMNRRSV